MYDPIRLFILAFEFVKIDPLFDDIKDGEDELISSLIVYKSDEELPKLNSLLKPVVATPKGVSGSNGSPNSKESSFTSTSTQSGCVLKIVSEDGILSLKHPLKFENTYSLFKIIRFDYVPIEE